MTTPRTHTRGASLPTPRAQSVTQKQPASKRKPTTVKRPRISERDFQKAVIDLAHTCGWRCHHTYAQGSVLGSKAVDRGFPDLILARGPQLIAIELKGSKGHVTEDQDAWLGAFLQAGIPAFVWFPDSWRDIEALLTAPERPVWHGVGGVA